MNIGKLLEEAGFNYNIDSDGDYKVTVDYAEIIRSQLVFINGHFEKLENSKIAHIWSVGYSNINAIADKKLYRKLLKYTAESTIGSWAIDDDGDLIFKIQVPAEELTPELIRTLVTKVAKTADDFEEAMGAGDDL